MNSKICIIGYGGHALVAIDILLLSNYDVEYYCDKTIKPNNPYNLKYIGKESELTFESINSFSFFIGLGDNQIRKNIFTNMSNMKVQFANAIHPQTIIASNVETGKNIMIAAGAVLNPFVRIGDGVICNTQCSIDHECIIGNFSHIAPGAVLCGNVKIGESSFIGANTVIREGITVGNNCVIGAGSVIIKNIEDNTCYVGNPGKQLK